MRDCEGVSSLLTICSTTNRCTPAEVTSLTVNFSGVSTSTLGLEDDALSCGIELLDFVTHSSEGVTSLCEVTVVDCLVYATFIWEPSWSDSLVRNSDSVCGRDTAEAVSLANSCCRSSSIGLPVAFEISRSPSIKVWVALLLAAGVYTLVSDLIL